MKIKSILKKLNKEDLTNGAKSWVAKKFFRGDEALMMNTVYTVGIVGATVLLFCMTNPTDGLITFVQKIFETIGWW